MSLSRNVRLVSIQDMTQGEKVINAFQESDKVTFGGEYGQTFLTHAELEGLLDYEGEGFEGFLRVAYEEVISAAKADSEVFFVL